MWAKYQDHVRPDFVKNFILDCPSRIWEMQIGCALLDLGIEIQVQDEGPDIRCVIDDYLVWIEAIAPTEGSGNDKVVKLPPGHVGAVPNAQIMLRYTSSFLEKHRKFTSYIKKKICSQNEVKVIAISGAKVPLADMEGEPYPRIVQALLGVGPDIIKRNGATVPNTYFLDRTYDDISAVLFCKHHIKNSAEVRGLEAGRDWIWVHNPLAKFPMPVGLLPAGQAYSYKLKHEDWRKPLPRPWLGARICTSLLWRWRIWRWERKKAEGADSDS